MITYIIKVVLVAASLLVAAHFVDGITIDRFWPTAVIAAVILGFLNTVIKPIISLFALPITILTLGLFSVVINVIIFWLLAFVPGVSIDGFFAALWGALIVAITGGIINVLTKEKK